VPLVVGVASDEGIIATDEVARLLQCCHDYCLVLHRPPGGRLVVHTDGVVISRECVDGDRGRLGRPESRKRHRVGDALIAEPRVRVVRHLIV